jgi:hypothetical protein
MAAEIIGAEPVSKTSVVILIGCLLIWNIEILLYPPTPVLEPPKPAPVASHPPPMESLFVSSATPTVVIVADLASEYAAKWMEENAGQLRAKGWKVQSVDLEGCDEVRFYVRAQGVWRTHNGQMSLAGLKAMLGQ